MIAAIIYARIPLPPTQVKTTAPRRTSVGSILKYSAMPAQTPSIILFLLDLNNLLDALKENEDDINDLNKHTCPFCKSKIEETISLKACVLHVYDLNGKFITTLNNKDEILKYFNIKTLSSIQQSMRCGTQYKGFQFSLDKVDKIGINGMMMELIEKGFDAENINKLVDIVNDIIG